MALRNVRRLFTASGHLSPLGLDEMQKLAVRSRWVSWPSAFPFLDGNGKLTLSADLWLRQSSASARNRPPQSAGNEGLGLYLRQLGIQV